MYKQYIVQLFRHNHESTIWSNITLYYILNESEEKTPTQVAEELKLAFNKYLEWFKEANIKYYNNQKKEFPSKLKFVMKMFDRGYHEFEEELTEIFSEYNFLLFPCNYKIKKIVTLSSIEDFLGDGSNWYFQEENRNKHEEKLGQIHSEVFDEKEMDD